MTTTIEWPAGLRPASELRALAEAGAAELGGEASTGADELGGGSIGPDADRHDGDARSSGGRDGRAPHPGPPGADTKAPAGTEASTAAVLGWLADNFETRRVAVACSMADAMLPHLVAERLPGVDVLFLDTGYHFPETYATRIQVDRELDVRVVDLLPEQTVAEQDAEYGTALHDRDPGLCCARRKVQPLQRALAGYEVWVTGIRREEAPTRTETPLIAWDERNGLVKVNPLAAWTFDDLLDGIASSAVPVNLLLANGYPSIGCAPCTRAVAPGDDPRSGRWAGIAKTECGLHS